MGQETRDQVRTRVGAGALSPNLIERLLSILSAETDAVTALLAAAESKQQALLDDDLSAIEEAAAREADLLQELTAWEAKRLGHMAGIEKELAGAGFAKEDGASLTLQELVGFLPEDDRLRLLDQGNKLREVTLRLQEINLLNASLLRHSLTLTNYCLSLLTGDTGQTTYGEPGKKDRPTYQQGRLDARA